MRRLNLKLKLKLNLSQRLSLVFAVLLLASCGASAWLQIRANTMREMEVVQAISRGLARSIALDARLIGADTVPGAVPGTAPGQDMPPDAVRRLFDQLMVVNPSVEVYLLDMGGRIVGHAAPPGRLKRDHVDLRPIRRLLDKQPLPILGDDPRSMDRAKVFSAAVLHNGEREVGYIYVILLGEAHDQLAAKVAASTVLRTTLSYMAIVALLALAAGLAALRLITRPLGRLTETMRRFDTRAEPVAVLPLAPHEADTRDDIAILETAFGQMAARIGEQWQSLRQLDQDRREVVANISHDLRTPLSSLHGYLETLSLKDATLDAAERQRYLGIALAQSRKVGRLAQSLFELALLEHGSTQPDIEPFSLSDLIQDVFQKFELKAAQQGVRLDAALPHPAPMVCADLGMIERVLTNLLDNAIRHTPAGGVVEVAVQLLQLLPHEGAAGRVRVTVADSGPGIPVELQAQLFRRPFALRGERRDGGLGLLIVHRILQLHGSSIELLAVPGRGAVFQFELKLRPR